jgi:hypothetical protein
MLKKLTSSLLAIAAMAAPSLSSAEALPPPIAMPIPLNTVTYPITVEKWATTNTAKVTVSMDAALDKVGLTDINSHVLENLNKMATKADWHITQFNRTQDKSGLEVLHVEAEARLTQDNLAGLRDKAKTVSKAGETYTVSAIDFSPSNTEMEATHAAARAEIYESAKQEITRLNQAYPEQHYFLRSLDFAPVSPGPVMYKTMQVTETPGPNVGNNNIIPVNAKITEMAQVVIGARVPKAADSVSPQK